MTINECCFTEMDFDKRMRPVFMNANCKWTQLIKKDGKFYQV